MAKKIDELGDAGPDAVIVKDMPAAVPVPVPAAPAELQPQRGGSYTRNADGTLTQTEGHGFAPD